MGKIIKRNLPCLDTGCGSSDARQQYEDGTSFCFSCQSWFKNDQDTKSEMSPKNIRPPRTGISKIPSLDEIDTYPISALDARKINYAVTDHYGVKVTYGPDGKIDAHFYPYGKDSYKIRTLPKQFQWVNKNNKLFGQDHFTSGGKRLVICEGEIDTLSVAQAFFERYSKIYPAVGISSSTQTKALLEQRSWIRSFDEVVLCFDDDDAGQEATENAIKIIGFDKVKIAKLQTNDINDTLMVHGQKAVNELIFNAETYVPTGIIGKDELWEQLEAYNNIESMPYPKCLEGINTKTKGMREGEISLFISGTGSGKSTIMREIEMHVLEETNSKIGIVSLEESPAETARKLAGMYLMKNPAKSEIPLEELKKGFDAVFGSDRVILLDHQGAINDNSIIEQLEYMCLVGCKYLFIDHITILVSEGVDSLTGNEAIDKMMNELLKVAKRYSVWIGLVSHLRKTNVGGKSFEEGKLPSLDDIRGSGSIKQISFDVISFARNMVAKEERERNMILTRILKCRHTGLTGVVPGARYDYDTGRLSAVDGNIIEDFVSLEGA